MVRRMMPGTEWWMCVPLLVTLFRNGPRPSRIMRVIVRVTTNVTTKATKHSISGSLPAAMMSRCHHDAIGSQGRGACEGPFPHPPFNPYVRFSRIRLTDDLLDMVTLPSDIGRCRGAGAGRAR